MFLILFSTCGYGVAGVLGVITAKDWTNDIVKVINNREIVKDIRTDIAATAVSVVIVYCVSFTYTWA